jgi:hypothetical protein
MAQRTNCFAANGSLEIFWGECSLVAIGGDLAQCANGDETAGPAGGNVNGTVEAVALSALQRARAFSAPRAENVVAVGGGRGVNCDVSQGTPAAGVGDVSDNCTRVVQLSTGYTRQFFRAGRPALIFTHLQIAAYLFARKRMYVRKSE